MARLWFAIAACLGVAAAVAGLSLLLTASTPASFGWTAYAPLSGTVFVPPTHQPLGLLLVVVGSATAGSGVTGWVLSRRPRA